MPTVIINTSGTYRGSSTGTVFQFEGTGWDAVLEAPAAWTSWI